MSDEWPYALVVSLSERLSEALDLDTSDQASLAMVRAGGRLLTKYGRSYAQLADDCLAGDCLAALDSDRQGMVTHIRQLDSANDQEVIEAVYALSRLDMEQGYIEEAVLSLSKKAGVEAQAQRRVWEDLADNLGPPRSDDDGGK